jgi:hypothetical protein
MKAKLLLLIASVLLVGGVLLPSSAPTHAWGPRPVPGSHPMLFVHGGAGSGAQWETQAMRFESNGYPVDYIDVEEYDSSSIGTIMPQVWAEIDQHIADLLAKTGATQVDLLGHSLGTTVSAGYLNSSPDRAAKVAHYVNIDGQQGTVPVPTLAIWAGRGAPGRQIPGATNVTIPNVTHVQSATCADSFVEIYKFFTGKEPATKDIIPEFPIFIKLAGRAVIFPQNSGVQDGTLEIWLVNGRNGNRIGRRPLATYPLSGDGSWGPFNAVGGLSYEFNIVRDGFSPHPFYYEPFLRSDYLIRLNTSPEPSGGVSGIMPRTDVTTNFVIGRNMELWGDQGAENDVLTINGTNVISPATNPIARLINYMFIYDQDADGVSHLGVPIAPFGSPFFTGVDFVVPGANPPNASIPLALTSRTGGGKTEVINVPNWASSQVRRISVQFHDYSQDINSWLEYVLSLIRK